MANGVEPLRERYQREPGLRERKKLKAMRSIQNTALGLFDEHGFDAVTIERVAAEAEVSASTVYRYFGTKEQLVLYDESDPPMLRILDEELAVHDDPVDAFQHAVARVLSEFATIMEGTVLSRVQHLMSVPSIRARMSVEVEHADALLREILSTHTGLDAGGLRLRVFVSSILHSFLALVEYWHETGYREPLEDLIDEAFAMVKNGLRL